MKTQFTFNSKTSAYADRHAEVNLMFIRQQELYFNDVLRIRGYLYLNAIYEMLGVRWDPEWENSCLLYKPTTSLKFGIRCANEDGFDIDIL